MDNSQTFVTNLNSLPPNVTSTLLTYTPLLDLATQNYAKVLFMCN